MSRTMRLCLACAAAGTLSLSLLAPAAVAGRGPGTATSSPAGARPAAPPAATAPSAAALRPQATPAGRRRPVPGTHPAWAVASRRVTARPVTSGTVTARVYLASRDPRGLAAFASAVSDPRSAGYQHYLTPAQVRARFGSSPAQAAAVRSWLRGAGLAVTAVHGGGAGAYVSVRGPVAAAGRAFGVTFTRYRGPGGRVYRAPVRAATVPAPAAAAVLAITGLDTAPQVMMPATARQGRPDSPCSHYYGQVTATRKPPAYGRHWPWAVCGYTPRQLRSAYNVTPSGMTGSGQAVAIVDAYQSPTQLADANRYARETGDAPFGPGQYRQYRAGRFARGGPRQCDAQGWYGEAALDVEAVHGLAPNAAVRYVAAGSCDNQDLAQALAFVVNRHLASIVSSSWGGLEQGTRLNAVMTTIFQFGAAEGIGFYFSSGDDGYNAPGENPGSPRIQVEFPTSSPWVTSVGGTSLAIGRHGQYEWETSWGNLNDPVAAGGRSWRYRPPGRYPQGYGHSGGGGVSTIYRQPSYQQGTVPQGLATHLPGGRVSRVPMRVIPDVAAVANPVTGMLVGRTVRGRKTSTYTRHPVGGTSLACPVFAAIQADAQQAAGHVFGFASPALYARYRTPAFHDVTDHPLGPVPLSAVAIVPRHPLNPASRPVLSLIAIGINGQGAAWLRAAPGYDDATGLGSPRLYIQSFRP